MYAVSGIRTRVKAVTGPYANRYTNTARELFS